MSTILLDSKFGFYYSSVRPFVRGSFVSLSNEVYSLEGEDSYVESNKIGTFTGYPANLTETDELNFGFSSSNGFICVGDKIIYNVINGLVSEYKEPPLDKSLYKDLILIQPQLPLQGRCTNSIDLVDTQNHLGFESEFDSNLICGVFSGEPGKYISVTYSDGSRCSNRVYGFANSTGSVILNCKKKNLFKIDYTINPSYFEFWYEIQNGVIHENPIVPNVFGTKYNYLC
jgi:hypothetical protein